MADYESTAYMSLERLKEQHGEELSKFQEMIRDSAEVGQTRLEKITRINRYLRYLDIDIC